MLIDGATRASKHFKSGSIKIAKIIYINRERKKVRKMRMKTIIMKS